jgi:hypothetical protein
MRGSTVAPLGSGALTGGFVAFKTSTLHQKQGPESLQEDMSLHRICMGLDLDLLKSFARTVYVICPCR